MPQFISSVVRSTQVAVAPAPKHTVGAMQRPPVAPQAHMLSVHVSPARHAMPGPPQFASSVVKSMQPREPIALSPQRRSPVHARLVPHMQPLAPQRSATIGSHAMPQPRQLENDESAGVVPMRFTQVVPQHCWLALQLGEQAPVIIPASRPGMLASTRTPVSVGRATGMHTCATQSSPDSQVIPQPPQLAGSLNVLRQMPLQHV